VRQVVQYFTRTTPERTCKSRGNGTSSPPSVGADGYGGLGSRFRGRIPGSLKAVDNINDIVKRHMYAPTAATAGLLLCHHHTHVVPNQTPEIPKSSVRDPINAQGFSPPTSKRPCRYQRDGGRWVFRLGGGGGVWYEYS